MINLFEFATDDKSLEYLAQVFGYMNGIIPIPTKGTLAPQPLPSGMSITLLGTMFKVFNSVILSVGALIVVYVTVIGVMQTAHEGEFMKKFNGLWMPMRIVLGIGAMFPTGSGYSGIQILMMWVVVQGIGAADKLWSTSLAYISVMGSPYASVTLPTVGVSNTMNNLFQGIVCDATLRESGNNPDATTSPAPLYGYYYCNASNASRDASFCNEKVNTFDASDTSKSTYSMGPGGVCGKIEYCNQDQLCTGKNSSNKNNKDSLACASCAAQVQALAKVINNTLIPIATYYEQTDYSYRNFYFNNDPSVPDAGASGFDTGWVANYCSKHGVGGGKNQCCVPGTKDCEATGNPFSAFNPYDDQGRSFGASSTTVKNLFMPYSIVPKYSAANFVQTTTGEYMDIVGKGVIDYITAHSKDAPLDAQLTEARDFGWIMAGAYYYFLGKYNSQNMTSALPVLNFTLSNPEQLSSNDYANARVNYGAVAALKQSMQEAGTINGEAQKGTAVASSAPDNSPDISTATTGAITNIQSTFQSTTKPNLTFNPLTQLQIAGSVILDIAQILYIVIIGLTVAFGLLSGLNGFIAGNGLINPMSNMSILLYMVLLPALSGLFAIMVSVGGLLAIYVPLIPYTIFTFGAIGWLLSVIETMVAGPLVALGILSPGGHHEVLGKAEPALMLLFNVFLRPSLMIFGLISSLLLASVVVLMINTAFWGGWMSVAAGTPGALGSAESFIPGPVTVGLMGPVTTDASGGTPWAMASPLAFLIFVCAYVALIVSAMNKCFEAIHIIPEKVMRWIGGSGESYGERDAVGAMKSGTESGASGAVKAGEGGQASAKAAGEQKGKEKGAAQLKKGGPSVG